MCSMCSLPDASYERYLDQMRYIISRNTWAVQFVEADEVNPALAYTVGLTAASCPELVVTGLDQGRAAELLNTVAERSLRIECPMPGGPMLFTAGLMIKTVRVLRPTTHLATARAIYGDRIEALQLVHADSRGKWPSEQAYRNGKGGQPILG